MSNWIVIRLQRLPISFRMDRRVIPVTLVLLLAGFVLLVLNIGIGQYPIAPADVVRALIGAGSKQHDFIVNVLRVPRALIAFLVGGGLAISGAILQGVTRNPLASPDVVGVTAGANLAAAAVLVYMPGISWAMLPPIAFAGALIVATITYLIAWQNGSQPLRLILVGIGVAAVAGGLISLIVATAKQVYQVSEVMLWLVGSVYGRSWEQVTPLVPWLAVFVPLAFLLSRHLNALAMGDDVARGLGSRLERHRGLLLLTSVALGGSAVATAGSVGFVGLMAPHIARRLVGPGHGGLLPVAGLVGGLIVSLADLLGRTIAAPIEIPCGVVTAAIGAPYFIYLLYKSRHA